MEWAPPERLAVAKVATPTRKVPLPSVVLPSKKVTVPVAPDGETIAVKVADCPKVDGLRFELRPVVVLSGGTRLTVAVAVFVGSAVLVAITITA